MASRRTWLYATGTPSRRRLHRWREAVRRKTPTRPEKLKRTGAVLSRQIASRRCCVRAARALLLGHRAGVAFWSVCCSVPRVGGRARSLPARRAQFFAGVLRSQRQSCHKRGFAFGARYRRALAPAFGAALSSGLAMRLVGRAADSSARRGPRALGTATRGTGRRRRKCRLSGLSARPMTQPDAYGGGRRQVVRMARWRSRRRAVLPGPSRAAPQHNKKSSLSGAKGSNRDRCCPTQRAP